MLIDCQIVGFQSVQPVGLECTLQVTKDYSDVSSALVLSHTPCWHLHCCMNKTQGVEHIMQAVIDAGWCEIDYHCTRRAEYGVIHGTAKNPDYKFGLTEELDLIGEGHLLRKNLDETIPVQYLVYLRFIDDIFHAHILPGNMDSPGEPVSVRGTDALADKIDGFFQQLGFHPSLEMGMNGNSCFSGLDNPLVAKNQP